MELNTQPAAGANNTSRYIGSLTGLERVGAEKHGQNGNSRATVAPAGNSNGKVAGSSDLAEIKRSLALLVEPGAVVELRAVDAVKMRANGDWGKAGTVSGYFNDLDKLAAAAAEWSGNAPAIWVTLNPVNPDLLARGANKAQPFAKSTTADEDVTHRRWLLIDADPTRPAGISSSEGEHAAALDLANAIRTALRAEGWPELVLADSGNGAHLLSPIDLPNDEGSKALLKTVLAALAARFDTEAVKVDPTTFNASRCMKLYGTMACKGDSIPTRPHRLARLLEVPADMAPVPLDLLEALAATVPAPKARNKPAGAPLPVKGRGDYSSLDVVAWFQSHSHYGRDMGGGKHAVLCPWHAEHSDNRGAEDSDTVTWEAEGNDWPRFHCSHAHCNGRTLRDVMNQWNDADRFCTEAFRPIRRREAAAWTAAPTAVGSPIEESGPQSFHCADLGNAKRLVARHGRDLRYSQSFGWVEWTGSRWRRDDSGEVDRRAKDTVASIYIEAGSAPTDADRKELAKWAIQSESANKIRAMIGLAETEPGIPVRAEQFDANAMLLNCMNGTIDLRTGHLNPHQREDLCTKLVPLSYDPQAECPTWEKFLHDIMGGNKDLVAFLRRAVGYSLTGDVSEQVLFFLHGSGSNGKSTFLNILRDLLDDYGSHAPPGLLLERKGDRHPTELADLKGRRLVTSTEVGEGKRMAEELVKQITGGDPIKGRFMRQDFFEFTPELKLWLAANHKPVIRGNDHAIWRRIPLIPFAVTFKDPDQVEEGDHVKDPGLLPKLKAELPGILAWAVRGCLEWQKEGLNLPQEVRSATEAYRAEMDMLAAFLSDCCVRLGRARASATVIYNTYKNWCDQNGERPVRQTDFSTALKERGYEKRRSGPGGGWEYWGIGLLELNPTEPFGGSARHELNPTEPTFGSMLHESKSFRGTAKWVQSVQSVQSGVGGGKNVESVGSLDSPIGIDESTMDGFCPGCGVCLDLEEDHDCTDLEQPAMPRPGPVLLPCHDCRTELPSKSMVVVQAGAYPVYKCGECAAGDPADPSSPAVELLTRLRSEGRRVTRVGENLQVVTTDGLTDETRQSIRDLKPALVWLLRVEADSATADEPHCDW